MNNEDLKKLQAVQKEILDEIVRICNKHDITVFLSGGTLLGAVRHKGFIPWDDDLDVCMFREDYDKFVNIVKAELADKYTYIDYNVEKDYAMCFAKIIKNNTVLLERNANPKVRNGIYVDVFPLDYIGDSPDAGKYANKLPVYKLLLLSKCHYRVVKRLSPKVKYGLKAIGLFYTKNRLKKNIEKCIKEIAKGEAKYCYEITDSGVDRAISKRYNVSDYAEIVKLEFEGSTYNAPSNFDNVLKALYGDYMQLPPVEARGNYHGIEILKFGEE